MSDTPVSEAELLARERDIYKKALERISWAKPDRLDHSIDIAIVERAARVANKALQHGKSVRAYRVGQSLQGPRPLRPGHFPG